MTTHSGMLRVSPLFSATVCFSAFLHDSVISTAATAANSNYWEVKTAAVTGVCEAEAIEQTEMPTLPASKFFRNGMLYIYHNGNVYNIMGTRVE